MIVTSWINYVIHEVYMYITGEEEDRGPLFVLELKTRILYQSSGAIDFYYCCYY